MNKVLAAFDGLKLSESTMEYAMYLAKEFENHITATFLEDIVFRPELNQGVTASFASGKAAASTLVKKETAILPAIEILKKEFNEAAIKYDIQKSDLIAIQALLAASHFADMILIDARESFSSTDKSVPSRFMKNLLANTNCPLLVVPEEFKPVEKVVFAFDGSFSSVYAARHFTYIFPTLPMQQVEIITVTDKKQSPEFMESALFEAFLKTKYPALKHAIIRSANTRETLVKYLQSQVKETLVVLGSYQRSALSRWIYKSIADTLIDKLDIPVFIAHK